LAMSVAIQLREVTMKKFGILALAVAVTAAGLVDATTASAQSNPKREKCLVEAQGKGLYTPMTSRISANTARANRAMEPQLRAFMAECMKRR
jgi:hypothetical protein